MFPVKAKGERDRLPDILPSSIAKVHASVLVRRRARRPASPSHLLHVDQATSKNISS